MKVDVDLKKSDAEWGRAFDRLGLNGAPVWFDWLSWTLMIGALQYVQSRVHSIAVGVVLGISGALFILYFQAFFQRYAFQNLPFARSPAAARIVSIALSALLGSGTWILLQFVIMTLSKTGA